MSERPFSRRDFLLSVGVAGAASAVLTACNGRQETPPADPAAPGADPAAPPQQAELTAAECPGYAQLTEDDHTIRRTLNYTDVSPEQGQYCDNCRFQIESQEYGPCLGCQLFAGPVTPRGWCSSWVAMT